jgi:hypothetical protein
LIWRICSRKSGLQPARFRSRPAQPRSEQLNRLAATGGQPSYHFHRVAVTGGDATGLYATGKRALEHTPELKDQRNATVLYVFGL